MCNNIDRRLGGLSYEERQSLKNDVQYQQQREQYRAVKHEQKLKDDAKVLESYEYIFLSLLGLLVA